MADRPEREVRRGRKGRRKVCSFCVDRAEFIDYKDVAKLRRFLMTAHDLSEDEAISLMSVAADFSVTQVVDANWGVTGSIPKAIFQGRARR